MKILLVFILLAGCAVPAPVEQEPIVYQERPQDEAQSSNEEPDDPKEREVRRKKPRSPPDKKEPPTTPIILPACESVPGDKKTAILQKLECVAETADKKTTKPVP